jgi:hypothetical protein
MVSYASLLTPDQIERAHAASLELLELAFSKRK